MKKVFLDDLPRWEIGNNKGQINWKECIGEKVKFIYYDKHNNIIEGEIEIVDYKIKGQEINIDYNNIIYSKRTNDLLKCKLGDILGVFTKRYRYNIGDVIENKFSKIKILEKNRLNNSNNTSSKSYKYKCLKCNNEDVLRENDIIIGHGCNVCCIPSKKILIGYNDLWALAPKIAKLLKYPEDGYKITCSSAKSSIFVCPDCGYEKNFRMYSIFSLGFSCSRCGDGKSYPEKFAFNLLEQLGLNFTPEYNPDWIKPKRYDFYFELNNKGYIFETDGGWHKKDNKMNGQTAEESKAIDDYKDMKAKENGIEVIRIDCEKSDLDYIKNNILTSQLNELFDLSNIDWLKCHEFALSTMVKEVCDYWNNGIRSTKEIKFITKLGDNTIIRYLKKGAKIGWCDYDPDISRNNLDTKFRRSVIQLTLEGEFIKKWDGIINAAKELNIKNNSIISCCRNRYKYAGGFQWMYEDDYKICNTINSVKHKKRKVVQLSLNNEFIKEWDSVNLVQDTLGIRNISQCCKSERKYSSGFRWMYKEDYDNNDILLNNIINYKNKFIIQLSLNNEFIQEYKNVYEAEKTTSILHISDCCKGKRKTAGKFKWMYKEDYEKYIEEQNKSA